MLRLFSLLSHLSFISPLVLHPPPTPRPITLSPSSTSLFCTMKGFHIVVLLSSAVLLVSAAPAMELVTCSEESGAAAAQLAMHRINENHRHGYKFRLQEIQGNKVEKADDGCNLELQLNLQETVCHVVNPKHFEDCQIRGEAERAVTANCTVKMSVKNNDANVTNLGRTTMLSLPLWRLIVQWEAESILRHANPSAPTELIMLSASQLTSGKPASSQSSVNSIPHRTRLPLALVSKSPYAGIILPMQAVADITLVPMLAMAMVAAIMTAMAVVAAIMTAMANVAAIMTAMAAIMTAMANVAAIMTTMANVAAIMTAMANVAAIMTAMATVAAIIPAMAILTKKSSIIGPHSVPNTNSMPGIASIAAMDRTQLSTTFAPGLVLGAAPAPETRTEIHHTTLKQP
ncbi:hypothetical protein PFLUV_G00114240 [Perca fluviatilis]|uniref:Cystatin domain-containing protein n=1 Tax=Perca fluviatilis TaxID=8168 RepID=A0A6A5EZ53_PERFL|nr:hypothetical protein PFLUV_G00114240 [Perca fluviatilis]